MGNQQQHKEVKTAQKQHMPDYNEEAYKIIVEKLFTSSIYRGKATASANPSPLVPTDERARMLSSMQPTIQHSQAGQPSETQKLGRSVSKMTGNMSKHPYPLSCVAYVVAIQEGKQTITGSAFLINRFLALTCAHNCMKPDSRKQYTELELRFKRDFQTLKVKVKKAHYLDGLFEGEPLKGCENYLDFSVLELQKQMDESQGHLGLAFDYDKVDPTTPVFICGYKNEDMELYKAETKLVSMSPKIIGISGKVHPLSYGGPVLVQINGQYFVFGIVLWEDEASPDDITRGFKLYRYLYELLNTNFSRTIGVLNMQYRWLTNQKMERLIREKYQLVTDLVLEGNRITPAGVNHLVKSDWFQLRQLNLNNNNIEDLGMETLCTGNWPKLICLKVGNNVLTTQGIQHLVGTNWAELRNLHVSQNKVRNKGLEYITKGPWKNMTQLGLTQTHINQDGVRIIANAGYKDLEVLLLGENRIREAGVKILVEAKWPDLHTLQLNHASITDEAVSQIEKSQWNHLKHLDLSCNHLTHTGVESLLRNPWRKLKDLNLRENKITMKGLNNMEKSGWQQLEQIDVRWNKLSDGDRKSLTTNFQKVFPHLKAYI